jgi:hypothetical protein
MNFVELLLSQKLKDRNPTLDLFGSDRRVLQIACEDLTSYLKFHWNLVGKEANECELVDKIEEFFNSNPKELKEFLDVWTGMWLRKWKERVKLLIGNQDSKRWKKATRTLNNAEPLWRKLTNHQEMLDMVISTLIRNGEICGTSILAKNLLKMELGSNKRRSYIGEEQVLNLVNNTMRKARELARSQGPLIFVRIDRGYYTYQK